MKLRGTTKLKAHMTNFLRPFGLKAILGKDFAYYPVTEQVQFTLVMEDRADKIFRKFIADTFNYEIKDMFLFSLLHEVGHHFTIDDFEYEELDKEWKHKSRIEWEIDEDNYNEKSIEYFSLPSEYAATAWAVSYMRDHEEELFSRWRIMLEHFRHFYKINSVSCS